jgi:hypothetical protein
MDIITQLQSVETMILAENIAEKKPDHLLKYAHLLVHFVFPNELGRVSLYYQP